MIDNSTNDAAGDAPRFAIVGAGPSGLFTAQALRRVLPACEIDVIDRLPTPFGLIRYGVAADHQGTKAIARQFERLFEREGVQFFGNAAIGQALPLEGLLDAYDAVVLATGLAGDRKLGIAGEDCAGVFGSGQLTRWLNNHPAESDFEPVLGDTVVIVGQGNVAIDIARLLGKQAGELDASDLTAARIAALARNRVRTIELIGRGAPGAAKFDPAMVRELSQLADARIEIVWPEGAAGEAGAAEAARIQALRHVEEARAADAGRTIRFRFGLAPLEIQSSGDAGSVSALRCRDAAGAEVIVAASAIVKAIGFEDGAGPSAFARPDADELPFRLADGLYAAGWFRRGPRGTIPECRNDAKALADAIAGVHGTGTGKPGRQALTRMLADAGLRIVDYAGWLRIKAAEEADAAKSAKPRVKLSTIEEMLAVAFADANEAMRMEDVA